MNQEYDLDNIDLTVQVGGENLSLPIGSTEKLKLKSLLSEEDFKYITENENGAYAFSMKDLIDFSDQIPDIGSQIKIDPININDKYVIDIENINLQNLTIDGQNFNDKISIEGINVGNISVPSITEQHKIQTGVSKYTPTAQQLTLDFPKIDASQTLIDASKLPIPPVTGDNVDIQIPVPAVSYTQNKRVNVELTLPEGVSNIRDIVLTPEAVLKIDISLKNSFLKKGSVSPQATMDLSELLTLSSGPIINLANDFTLSETNGYSVSKTYNIRSLNVGPSDWNGNILTKSMNVAFDGEVTFNNIITTKNLINQCIANGQMGLDVRVSFENVKIKDMTMDIAPITDTKAEDIAFNINDITLPEEVNAIKEVKLKSGSEIRLDIKGCSFGKNMTANLNELKITFPKEIVSDDLTGNSLTISNADLSADIHRVVRVKSLKPASPVGGVIKFDKNIAVSVSYDIHGSVKLSELPAGEKDEPAIEATVSSNMVIDDYYAVLNPVSKEISREPYSIKLDLPADVGEIGTFAVYPAQSQTLPQVTFEIIRPQFENIALSTERGLKITFPKLFRFKNVNPSYNYNETENSINLTGALPDKVVLDIEKLEITPVKDPAGAGYFAEGQLIVSGNADIVSKVPGGERIVSGKEADALAAEGITINASTPEMTAETVSMEQFEQKINEKSEINLFDLSEIPSELKSISEALLGNTALTLSFSVENLPDMGNPLILDLNIALPKEIIFEDSRVDKDNILHINTPVSNSKITLEPLKISKLNLSEIKLDGTGTVTREIAVNGSLSVQNPTIDPSEISGRRVTFNFSASIPQVKIEKVNGRVDYRFDNMNQSIELDGLPDFVKGEDFVLDVANPHIGIVVKSNVGIPVKGSIKITPFIKGSAVEENSIDIIGLEIPASASAEVTRETKLWIGKNTDGMPGDFEWLQANVAKVLKRIPDSLQIKIDAGSDVNSREDHVVEPDATYKIALDYDVNVPLEFGKDLNISVKDTLPDMPADLGKILKTTNLRLFGDVETALPLQMDLKIRLLDSKSQEIKLKRTVHQSISACNSDGSASTTPLDLFLEVDKSADNVEDLSSMELEFKVTSPNYTGLPITSESYLQARLCVSIPGGITMDLN